MKFKHRTALQRSCVNDNSKSKNDPRNVPNELKDSSRLIIYLKFTAELPRQDRQVLHQRPGEL